MKRIQVIFSVCLALLLSECKKKEKEEELPEAAKEKIIEIKTDFGNMYMWLYKQTPLHRDNFFGLADTNFFDSTTFHRVVSDFVIQGGDVNSKDNNPNNDGSGSLGYTIPAEFDTSLTHIYGAVGAARTQNPEKASNSSQFYIVVDDNGANFLDNEYTVFGFIMKGMDVAVTIAGQPKNSNDKPLTDIKIDVNILSKTLEEIKSEYNYTPPQ